MHKTMIRIIPFIALAVSMASLAEPTPEDAAKYRQSIMKAMSGHNGAISLMVRDKAGNPDNLASHVQALVNLKNELDSLFNEGSDLEDDEALPAIWENSDAFAGTVDNFEAAVEEFSMVASDGDMLAIDAAHRELGKACRACHDDFRQKKED